MYWMIRVYVCVFVSSETSTIQHTTHAQRTHAQYTTQRLHAQTHPLLLTRTSSPAPPQTHSPTPVVNTPASSTVTAATPIKQQCSLHSSSAVGTLPNAPSVRSHTSTWRRYRINHCCVGGRSILGCMPGCPHWQRHMI